MTTHTTYKNNVWLAIVILLLISIATAAITVLLVTYFAAIKTFIPILVVSVCSASSSAICLSASIPPNESDVR